jgi:hypothetical protein
MTYTMLFPIPALITHATHEPPDPMPDIARVDVLWDRPVFRAPPLIVAPPQSRLELFPSDPRETREPLAS